MKAIEAAACWAAVMTAAALGPVSQALGAERAEVEVAFVLDTTGSMGGLLEGAKQKVWAIANEIAKGKPAPKIKMALVAYRDKGDEYVTKVFDLSSNLDQIYKDLLALSAGGGGDGPEHVIQGLDDAVERLSWSRSPKAFKVIYLVGDAAPHEDYADAPKLSAVLEKAVRKGVTVNAVQCGGDAQTSAAWQRVARFGEGKFLAIPQDGGMVAVATPFDEKLAELNGRLESTMIGYGAKREEAGKVARLAAAVRDIASAPAAAERAAFKAKDGFSSELDLAQAVEEGSVKLNSLKEDELPAELKPLSPAQREQKLGAISRERKALRGQLDSLVAQRAAYLAKQSAQGPKDSFDAKLVESLKTQASRKGIVY